MRRRAGRARDVVPRGGVRAAVRRRVGLGRATGVRDRDRAAGHRRRPTQRRGPAAQRRGRPGGGAQRRHPVRARHRRPAGPARRERRRRDAAPGGGARPAGVRLRAHRRRRPGDSVPGEVPGPGESPDQRRLLRVPPAAARRDPHRPTRLGGAGDLPRPAGPGRGRPRLPGVGVLARRRHAGRAGALLLGPGARHRHLPGVHGAARGALPAAGGRGRGRRRRARRQRHRPRSAGRGRCRRRGQRRPRRSRRRPAGRRARQRGGRARGRGGPHGARGGGGGGGRRGGRRLRAARRRPGLVRRQTHRRGGAVRARRLRGPEPGPPAGRLTGSRSRPRAPRPASTRS